MLVPAERVLQSIRRELDVFLNQDKSEASPSQSVGAALNLLETRESGGASFMHARFDSLAVLLDQLAAVPVPLAEWRDELTKLRAAIAADRRGSCLQDLEKAWSERMSETELLFAKIVETALLPALQAKLLSLISQWEIGDRRSMLTPAGQVAGLDTTITHEKLERYLRERFHEPSLQLINFQPLPGGFGKHTTLFEVGGRAIGGWLVMRRDPITPTVDNDCHRIRNEYPVIRAAFERGFPAPDALWLDTEHKLLPGGDFIVMRRAAGQTGGNVFRATATVSDGLVQVLAESVARLHTMPPCKELGNLTNSIRTDWWDLSLHECVLRYVSDWNQLFLSNAHNASPTLMSLFGWLLQNIPSAAGRPVLLHGDIGFHNMLIDEGRLTALVDWEFSHIGDPAEDLACFKNISGATWDDFMSRYRAAGGPEIDAQRLHFFQVWGYVRNAAASNLTTGKFESGALGDLKLAYTGHFHFPYFIQAACDLIEAGPGGQIKAIDY